MALAETYTYTVIPRRPIKNIVKGKVIFKATNLSLTKEEVLQCMKYGAVYRKFYMQSDPERVTPSNLDRLHRSEHISEEQYKAILEKEKDTVVGASEEVSGTDDNPSPDNTEESSVEDTSVENEGSADEAEDDDNTDEESASQDDKEDTSVQKESDSDSENEAAESVKSSSKSGKKKNRNKKNGNSNTENTNK
jgi:hypothetical protein